MLTHSIPDSLPFEGIKTKKIEVNEHFRVVLISLQQGEHLDAHASPTDAFIYVLKGTADFNLEGETIFLAPGDGLSFKAKQTHSIHALTDFKILLIR
jgi:quercetin dioxygenase-like cupin family protein